MTVRIFTGAPKMEIFKSEWDWAGRWRNRHEQVTERAGDAKNGEPQWFIRCLCGREFVVAESQLGDHRIVLCPNWQRGRR